jgi:hypothetical protein
MSTQQKARHTCNDGQGPAFGRKTAGCPRCDQLLAGAAPVRWHESSAQRDARMVAEIRAHNCRASGCGRVCTFGEW